MHFTKNIDHLTSIQFKETTLGSDTELKLVCFLFHGYGSNMDDMCGLVDSIANGILKTKKKNDQQIVFIIPNGISPCGGSEDIHILGEEGARQWFDITEISIEYMLPKLEISGKTVMAFITSQLQRLGLTIRNAFVGGFSQGAILASHIGDICPTQFRGIISCSGGFLSLASYNKELIDKNTKTPYTLIHGKQDGVIPYSWSVIGGKELKARGNKVQEFYIENMGHQINDEVVQIITNTIINN